jgi:hypothetical protein
VVEELRGFRCRVEFKILSTAQLLNLSAHKKTGRRKLNSPPGLKLLVWNYEIAP